MKFDPDHNPHPLERPAAFATEAPAPKVTEVRIAAKAVEPKDITPKKSHETYHPDENLANPFDSKSSYATPKTSHVSALTAQQGHAYPDNGRA